MSLDDEIYARLSPEEQTRILHTEALLARAEQAEAKAAAYERDWYAAKSDFGTAMGKARGLIRAADARVAELEVERALLVKLADAAEDLLRGRGHDEEDPSDDCEPLCEAWKTWRRSVGVPSVSVDVTATVRCWRCKHDVPEETTVCHAGVGTQCKDAATCRERGGRPRSETPVLDELAPLRARLAKGRAKYPNGCTAISLLDEAGEVAHALNKYEAADRVRDEILDVASVAMRLYLGEVDTGLTIDGLVQRRTDVAPETGSGERTAETCPILFQPVNEWAMRQCERQKGHAGDCGPLGPDVAMPKRSTP